MLATAKPLRSLSTHISNHPYTTLSSHLLAHCTTPTLLHQLHSRFIIHGLHQHPALSSHLLARYAALGRPDLSLALFRSIRRPDTPLFNALLRAHHNNANTTFTTYRNMLLNALCPDDSTYLHLLRACTDSNTARQIHSHVVKMGCEMFILVGVCLVEVYLRCRAITDARTVFDRMPKRDIATWNAIINAECEVGNAREGIRLFGRMRVEELVPDSQTMISLTRACVELDNIKCARCVHGLVVLNGLGGGLSVCTALLTMYCKLGCAVTARELFDRIEGRDCAVWNVMMSGYSRSGSPEKGVELLVEMVRSGVRTDMFTAIASLASVSQLRSLAHGRQIHGHVIRNGSDCQASVYNSLMEMYCNCKSLDTARKLFDSLTMKDMVPWSCMIKGYLSNNRPYESLALFGEMRKNGVEPDSVTLINVLPACVDLGALEQVKIIHGYAIKQGLNSALSVDTALLDSYSKCGCLDMAQELFEEQINQRDVVLWNSMISAYSKHGNWCQSFELYNRMKDSGVNPDHVTFVALLTACKSSGLLKEALDCFAQMVETYGLQPDQEHYACVLDLLGRSGKLDEAKSLIEKMPFNASVKVWGPLLRACAPKSATTFAAIATKKLLQLDSENPGTYITLSNHYAAIGDWEGVARMRRALRAKGLKKTPGISWLEVNKKVHTFLVMDDNHPEYQAISEMLKVLQQGINNYAEMLH